MNKSLLAVIVFLVAIIAVSFAYYFLIFQPQLAVNSCLVRAKKDFETSQANECKYLYETGQTLYKNCLNRGLTPGVCVTLTFDSVPSIWPDSPSLGCQIPDRRMAPLKKDYDDAVAQCKSLSIINLR
jgi:hypothetical protein